MCLPSNGEILNQIIDLPINEQIQNALFSRVVEFSTRLRIVMTARFIINRWCHFDDSNLKKDIKNHEHNLKILENFIMSVVGASASKIFESEDASTHSFWQFF